MRVENYQNADYKKTDSRGRLTLGQEYADTTVAVAWTGLPDIDPDDAAEPTEAEREIYKELHDWAESRGVTPLDFDAQNGLVYTTNAEWLDTSVEGLVGRSK